MATLDSPHPPWTPAMLRYARRLGISLPQVALCAVLTVETPTADGWQRRAILVDALLTVGLAFLRDGDRCYVERFDLPAGAAALALTDAQENALLVALVQRWRTNPQQVMVPPIGAGTVVQ